MPFDPNIQRYNHLLVHISKAVENYAKTTNKKLTDKGHQRYNYTQSKYGKKSSKAALLIATKKTIHKEVNDIQFTEPRTPFKERLFPSPIIYFPYSLISLAAELIVLSRMHGWNNLWRKTTIQDCDCFLSLPNWSEEYNGRNK